MKRNIKEFILFRTSDGALHENLQDAERLSQLQIEQRDQFPIHAVPHAPAALPLGTRRVRDQQPRLEHLLESVEHGGRGNVEGGGDLGA